MRLQTGAHDRPSPLAALFAIGLAGGCATLAVPAPGAAPAAGADAESANVFDPVGGYDVTMSSERMVSEGMMEVRGIRGEPGSYTGVITVGSVTARIVNVDAGEDHMTVHAIASQGTLILRLAWDGEFLSGNWILGAQRGTFAGRKRPDQPSGGSVSIGRSSRPPHSDQDPS